MVQTCESSESSEVPHQVIADTETVNELASESLRAASRSADELVAAAEKVAEVESSDSQQSSNPMEWLLSLFFDEDDLREIRSRRCCGPCSRLMGISDKPATNKARLRVPVPFAQEDTSAKASNHDVGAGGAMDRLDDAEIVNV